MACSFNQEIIRGSVMNPVNHNDQAKKNTLIHDTLIRQRSSQNECRYYSNKKISFFLEQPFLPLLPLRGSTAKKISSDFLKLDVILIEWLRDGKDWRLLAILKALGYSGSEPKSIRFDQVTKLSITQCGLSSEVKDSYESITKEGKDAKL